jgi:hypothetical protein
MLRSVWCNKLSFDASINAIGQELCELSSPLLSIQNVSISWEKLGFDLLPKTIKLVEDFIFVNHEKHPNFLGIVVIEAHKIVCSS